MCTRGIKEWMCRWVLKKKAVSVISIGCSSSLGVQANETPQFTSGTEFF
jgi:predicted aldo/keto reductase-like oxidoreductase